MSFAKFVFKTVDIVFDLPQNPHRLEKHLADVEVVNDIHYSENFPGMLLDVYRMPADDGKKYPVIFEIHGGGFAAGDKKYRRCFCRYLAKYTGAAVFNANYGTGSEQACPLPMKQLVDAVNWVVAHAEEYNLDLSKFVVTGDSAGAYYACFLATLQNSTYLQQLYDCKLNAVITATVLNCGVYDFKFALNQKMLLTKGICKELTGMDVDEAKQSVYFEGLTLTTHIDGNFPQTLLIYSENDLFVRGQGERLQEVLKEKEVPARCIGAKSIIDNHVYNLVWVTTMAKQTNEQILEFLNEHFGNVNVERPVFSD